MLCVLAALITTGCASKQELDEAQAQVAACEDEKVQLNDEIIAWEARFDRESSRWDSLGSSVEEAVPNALSEFHREREQILALVPEQVQGQVEEYLEDYFTTVMSGFDAMTQETADIKLQLETTNRVIQQLGADTRAGDQAITQRIDRELADERAKTAAVSQEMTALIDRIAQFDQDYINCKGCDTRLRLNKKQRAAILGLHADLTTALATLQSSGMVQLQSPDSPALTFPGDDSSSTDGP